MGLFKDMFGSSVKEIRERNIAKREAINKVKKLKQRKEEGRAPADIEKAARDLQDEMKGEVTYEEALEYVKDERKSAARRKKTGEVLGFLGQVGQRARADTEQRYRKAEPPQSRNPFAGMGKIGAGQARDPFAGMGLSQKRRRN